MTTAKCSVRFTVNNNMFECTVSPSWWYFAHFINASQTVWEKQYLLINPMTKDRIWRQNVVTY